LIFGQIRRRLRGEPLLAPTGRDVLQYVGALYDAVTSPLASEAKQVQMVKRSMNYVGVGVDAGHHFIHAVQRAQIAPTSSASARRS